MVLISIAKMSKTIAHEKQPSDVIAPSLLRRILPKTIRNYNDLIKMRSVNSTYADVVDNDIDEVWERLMTRDDLIKAGLENFTPALEKYVKFESEVNLFPAMVLANLNGKKEFYEMAKPLVKEVIPRDIFLITMCRLGDLEAIKAMEDSDNEFDEEFEECEGLDFFYSLTFVTEPSIQYVGQKYALIQEMVWAWNCLITSEYDNYPEETDYTHTMRSRDIKFLTTETHGFILAVDCDLMFFALHSGNEDLVDFLLSKGLSLDEPEEHAYNNQVDIYLTDAASMSDNVKLVRKLYWHILKTGRGSPAGFDTTMELEYPKETDEFTKKFSIKYLKDETDEFNEEDYLMVKAIMDSISQDNGKDACLFIEFIFAFGNICFYSLAHQCYNDYEPLIIKTLEKDESRFFFFAEILNCSLLKKSRGKTFSSLGKHIEDFSPKLYKSLMEKAQEIYDGKQYRDKKRQTKTN